MMRGAGIMALMVVALAVAGAWWWRASGARSPQAPVMEEPWDQAKEQYPMPPQEPGEADGRATELSERVAKANPFSSERRRVALTMQREGQPAPLQAPAPPAVEWVYKGRIDMGSRRRAILEDAATRKTHFLEVGQEVAGFKVLDIVENQVVLSDTKAGREVTVPLASEAGAASASPSP